MPASQRPKTVRTPPPELSWSERIAALPLWLRIGTTGLVLTGAALVAFWPQMFDGAGFPWDFTGKCTTAPAFVSASIDNGEIPRWAPGTGAGMPILEDAGSGAYYPLWWMTGLLSITLTFSVFAKLQVLHVMAGVIGMVAFGRARRIGWTWSTVGAVAFLFNGAFFGQVAARQLRPRLRDAAVAALGGHPAH